MVDDAPLILTLAFEAEAQARFDALRLRHFPPARNHVPAHVTLFHALPGLQLQAIRAALVAACQVRPAMTVSVAGLRPLGRGVAYEMRSDELSAFRGQLAKAWRDWLTPQDAQGYRPHLTIQNKAPADEARHLLEAMRASFAPFAVRVHGVTLWRYLGGPWARLEGFAFAG